MKRRIGFILVVTMSFSSVAIAGKSKNRDSFYSTRTANLDAVVGSREALGKREFRYPEKGPQTFSMEGQININSNAAKFIALVLVLSEIGPIENSMSWAAPPAKNPEPPQSSSNTPRGKEIPLSARIMTNFTQGPGDEIAICLNSTGAPFSFQNHSSYGIQLDIQPSIRPGLRLAPLLDAKTHNKVGSRVPTHSIGPIPHLKILNTTTQIWTPATFSEVKDGAIIELPLNSIRPGQMSVGHEQVQGVFEFVRNQSKDAFQEKLLLHTYSAVIAPNGTLFLGDGHHRLTAASRRQLEDFKGYRIRAEITQNYLGKRWHEFGDDSLKNNDIYFDREASLQLSKDLDGVTDPEEKDRIWHDFINRNIPSELVALPDNPVRSLIGQILNDFNLDTG